MKRRKKQIRVMINLNLSFVAILIFITFVKPVTYNTKKAKQCTFEVDTIGYSLEDKEYIMSLHNDSIEYEFSARDTKKGLSEKIKKGDTITIKYVEVNLLFKDDYYLIVDARTEDEVYVSIDTWDKRNRESAIVFIFLSLLLMSIPFSMDALIVWSHIYEKKRMQRIKLFQIIEKYGSDNYRVIKNLDTKLYARFESEYRNYWLDAYDASKYARKNEFVIKKENTSEEDKTNMGYLVVFGNDDYDITFYDLEKYGRYKKDVLEEKEQVNIIDQDDFAALIDKYLKM